MNPRKNLRGISGRKLRMKAIISEAFIKNIKLNIVAFRRKSPLLSNNQGER